VRGKDEIIAVLADVLANELTAINQYTLHAGTCAHWGYQRLASKFREEAQDERGHADLVINRILFLEGTPDMQRYHTVQGGKTVREQLEANLALEHVAIGILEPGIALARQLGDNGTEALLVGILVSEQSGVDWIEAQLHQIGEIGEQLYLAQQIN